MRNTRGRSAVVFIALALGLECALLAQTVITPPKNKFTPEQDVEYGQQAAAEIRRQYPVINDEAISGYLTMLGGRLVAAAPPELNLPQFRYSFTALNVPQINAFALPGGPMFVYSGMFDAADNEAEVAGVMAHELSHVLLRHGTANETKAENPWLQLGKVAGAVGGAMVGGAAGSAIAVGSEFGAGTMLLHYSRDYEKQADLLGSQIMARAGYDPRELAHMFEKIEQQAKGSENPQWLSDHPNPGNRTEYINKEADALTIATPPDMSQFQPIKAKFAALPSPNATRASTRRPTSGNGAATATAVGTPGQPVPPPSSEFHTFRAGNVFEASVPENWTNLSGQNAVMSVPENGYGPLNGKTVFTHGVEFGVTKAASRDLREATRSFLLSISRSNPDVRTAGDQKDVSLSQRGALWTPLTNPSALGGHERVTVTTTFLSDGSLFYFMTVAPESDTDAFEPTFQKIFASVRLMDSK